MNSLIDQNILTSFPRYCIVVVLKFIKYVVMRYYDFRLITALFQSIYFETCKTNRSLTNIKMYISNMSCITILSAYVT